jgi:hypothetical protein
MNGGDKICGVQVWTYRRIGYMGKSGALIAGHEAALIHRVTPLRLLVPPPFTTTNLSQLILSSVLC